MTTMRRAWRSHCATMLDRLTPSHCRIDVRIDKTHRCAVHCCCCCCCCRHRWCTCRMTLWGHCARPDRLNICRQTAALQQRLSTITSERWRHVVGYKARARAPSCVTIAISIGRRSRAIASTYDDNACQSSTRATLQSHRHPAMLRDAIEPLARSTIFDPICI